MQPPFYIPSNIYGGDSNAELMTCRKSQNTAKQNNIIKEDLMEQKQLTQFTFYDLYWDLIRQSDDSSAGRLVRNICQYMFTDEAVDEPQDDKENFFWSSIVDLLEEDKQIEMRGNQPKNLNAKIIPLTKSY